MLPVLQALVQFYECRKAEDGWPKERLVPLLAGVVERIPWLLQWHNEPTESFRGRRPGQSYEQFLVREVHTLGGSVDVL